MAQPTHVVVVDFDGTLTPKEYKSLWLYLETNGGVKSIFRKRIDQLRDQYLSKALTNKLSLEDSRSWVEEPINMYIKSELTIADIENILSSISLREGVVECLDFLAERQIPVAIISYGIADFIDTVLHQHRLSYGIDKIFATKLEFNYKNGRVIGYKPETIVIPQNKGEISYKFADIYSVPYKNILAIGDSGADANLGHLKENRLGIADNEIEKERIGAFMGEVVITQDFKPVQEWLAQKIDGSKD